MNYVEKFYKKYPLKKFTINNKNWEYIVCGKGRKTFLILPGGGQTAQIKFKLIKTLEDKYRVIAVTIYNCDYIEEFNLAINKILSKEKAGKLIVYGLSLGGELAQSFLKRNKEKIEKVIISHACTPKSKIFYKKIINPLKTLDIILPLIPNIMIRIFTKKLTYWIQGGDKKVGNKIFNLLSEEERELSSSFRKEFYDRYYDKRMFKTWINLQTDFYNNEKLNYEDFKGWKGKMLILRTDNDPLMQDEGDFRKIYPQAKIFTFKDTGHLTYYYQFNKMIEVIKRFL